MFFLINVFHKIFHKEIVIDFSIFNKIIILKIIIFFFLYNLFFIYLFFIFPNFFLINILNFVKLVLNITVKTRFQIYKPEYGKYSFFSFKDTIKIIFIEFPRTWSFLLFYFFLKKNKNKFSFYEILNNIGISSLTSRPVWFWTLSQEITSRLVNLVLWDVWKRKRLKAYPSIIIRHVKLIYYSIMMEKTLFYFKLTEPLSLDIINIKINGIEIFLKNFKTNEEILVFDKFLAISLNETPHIILTSYNKPYGQIMTSSKTIYVNPEQTTKSINLTEKQKTVFSLINNEDLIHNQDIITPILYKIFKKSQIDTSEKFIGFIYKANLLYWTDLNEKILWQPFDEKNTALLLNEDSLPLIKENFQSEEERLKMILRYKFSLEQLNTYSFWKKKKEVEIFQEKLIKTDIKTIYLGIKKINFNDNYEIENKLELVYENLKNEFKNI